MAPALTTWLAARWLIDNAQFSDSKQKAEHEVQKLEQALEKNQDSYKRLELMKDLDNKRKSEAFTSLILILGRLCDAFRTLDYIE